MISPKNQEEFKSLGIETVRRREAASVWDEGKAREAREWISNEETRIARSGKNAAWTAATAAIIYLSRFSSPAFPSLEAPRPLKSECGITDTLDFFWWLRASTAERKSLCERLIHARLPAPPANAPGLRKG